MNHNYVLEHPYRCVFATPNDGYSYFFGYYDKSPFNRSRTRLLTHRVPFDGREVRDGDWAEVGTIDLSSGTFHKLDETLAWNWQQGAQLQWLPPDYERFIIYNVVRNNTYGAVIHDLATGETRAIDFPVYVVHPGGKEALGVNYERLYWCRRGYNYRNVHNPKWDVPYHAEDGIFRIDLTNNRRERIISMLDMVRNSPLTDFETCPSWLEHMMYNPAGDRFMFFHRWRHKGYDQTRLYTANRDGSEYFMFPDHGFYSHADWKNNSELTIWSKEPTTARRQDHSLTGKLKSLPLAGKILGGVYRGVIKPLLSPRHREHISPQTRLINYHDRSDVYEVLGDAVLRGNGHTTWNQERTALLNDTYHDENGYRHLMLFFPGEERMVPLGRFFSHYNHCPYRADLHPRFGPKDVYVVIDTAHTTQRKILILRSSETPAKARADWDTREQNSGEPHAES